MVLIRIAALGLVGLGLAGCGESLLGAPRPGPADAGSGSSEDAGQPDAADDDPPGVCTGSCIADAAADFDGTAHGVRGRWKYVEDLRNLQWMEMQVGAVMTGLHPDNRITTCSTRPDARACALLPGGLLVSAAGADSTSDPAFVFIAPAAQALDLRLRAVVPDGGAQTIRLYRNSREDALLTLTLEAGEVVDRSIAVDALPGDRFFVAIVPPTDEGAVDIGLNLTAYQVRAFPSTCQFAFDFDLLQPTSAVDALCSEAVLFVLDESATGRTMEGPPPFTEQIQSLRIATRSYLAVMQRDKIIDYAPDSEGVTVQFWINLRSTDVTPIWLFSDLDRTRGGGIGLTIVPGSPALLQVTAGTAPAPSFVQHSVAIDELSRWKFLRVVRTSALVQVCVNGAHVMTIDAPAPRAASHPLQIGKDVEAAAATAALDGSIDDLRVITGALPCAP